MLRIVSAMLLSLGLVAGAGATEEHPRFAVGTHYKILESSGAVENPDKVEVREFFSYACPHCYSLEPAINDWLEDKPEFIDYVRTPVLFLKNAEPLARAYYVEEALGLVEEMHGPIFDAIHKHREALFNEPALANFFHKYGVETDKFNKLYSSFGVSTKIRQADALTKEYQIPGVPNFVVNGKYLVLRSELKDTDQLFEVIEYLAEKERNDT